MAFPVGEYEVDKEDDSELGHGASGFVWPAKHLPSGTVVAVKRVKLGDDSFEGKRHREKYVLNETEILKSLDHRNVIKLYHSEQKGKYLYMFIELCQRGDLNKFIKEELVLLKELAFRFILNISEALLYLHEHDPVIIHRDVKPDNLLVHGDDNSNYCIKITDFAFSKRAPQASTYIGSPDWMAPEVRPDKDGNVRYSTDTDVYSAGLVFLSVVDHKQGRLFVVFDVNGLPLGEWMFRNRMKGKAMPIPAFMKKTDDGHIITIKGTILQMVCADPADRCSMRQVRDSIKILYDNVVASPATQSSPPTLISQPTAQPTPPSPSQPTAQPTPSSPSQPTAGPTPPTLISQSTAGPTPPTLISLSTIGPTPPTLIGQPTTGPTPPTLFSEPTAGPTPPTLIGQPTTGPTPPTLFSEPTAGPTPPSLSQPSAQPAPHTPLPSPGSTGACGGAAATTPVPSKTSACELTKLGQLTLPVTGIGYVGFGKANLLVAFKRSPHFYYYEYQSDRYELIWKKQIPKEVKHYCLKHLSPRGEFFLQVTDKEVCVFDRELRLIRTLSSPGGMICLLPRGERAVVDNGCSPSSRAEGLRLAVTSAADLNDIHHQLAVPAEGAYIKEDVVRACGLEDGRLAVVVQDKPYCDLYGVSGHHMVRSPLPGGAGWPTCTSSVTLVPLWLQAKICVLEWSGQLTQILDHRHLGLRKDDWAFSVSPLHEGRLSLWIGSPAAKENQIHTYQLLQDQD